MVDVKKATLIDPAQINRMARFAQALSDPVRLHILALLLAGKGACCPIDPAKPTIGVCVCEITEHLGLSQSKVSYHLGKLKKVGLIQEERFGKWNHYVINHQMADDFITAYAGFFSR